jgi:putative DNA primase/helicase
MARMWDLASIRDAAIIGPARTETKAGNSAIKSFVTRRYDRFRPPFGKHIIRVPRSCVFAGTINPLTGGYLRDPTGARRFSPLLCHGMIDREGVERDRDQLWAEAVVRYKRDPCFLETPELEALATAEQKARLKSDVWKEAVEQWLGKQTDVSLAEVLEHALGIVPGDPRVHSAEIGVVDILKDLGFAKRRMGGKPEGRSYRYQRKKS